MNKLRGRIRGYCIQLSGVLLILTLLIAVSGNHLYVTHAVGNNHTHIPNAAKSADWPMFMQDLAHSSYDSTETVINPSSVGSLKPRWIYRAGGTAGVTISTQPVVSNGLVYWGSWDGYEHATNPTNPTNDVWKVFLGQTAYNANCSPPQLGVASTASINTVYIRGTKTSVLFVGGGDSSFYALNAFTGQKIWSTPFGSTSQGYFLWSSPTFYKGYLYFGVASWGDCPLVQGEFVKLKATNGKIARVWYPTPTDTPGCIGGGIWSSAAIDKAANTLLLNTGTSGTCSQYGQAVIELNANDLSLVGAWQPPASEQVSDGDFGASPTLFKATFGGTNHTMVGEENKNGIYYAFDSANISAGPVWETRLSNAGTNIASSAWDGTYLYLAGNDTTINGVNCDASLQAADPATGKFVWQDCLMGGRVNGTVTVVPGLAIVGVGSVIYAVATTTPAGTPGQMLFSYQDTSFNWYYAGPSISNGVLYASNSDGNLFAFTLNGQ